MPFNKVLLRGRNLGTTCGKRQQEKWFNHLLLMPPSQAFSLRTNPFMSPGSLRGVPTLLFLKLTRTGLVQLSALCLQTRGLLGLALTSRGQAQLSWASSEPGAGGRRNGPPRLSSHLNGNAPPIPARLRPNPRDPLMRVSQGGYTSPQSSQMCP